MNDTDNKKYTICPCCGATVPSGKFCPECGSILDSTVTVAAVKEQKTQDHSSFGPGVFDGKIEIADQNDPLEEHKPVDDSGLTLLGEFCKKTVATVGGDGYDEIVLYEDEKDGSYQIHTYSKYVYMSKESHHSFKAKAGAYDALLELAEKLRLDEYEGKRGTGLCGATYICKYSKDGAIHRVTTDNCGADGPSIIAQVGNLLGSYKGEEITQ